MKKILVSILICLITSICYAQTNTNLQNQSDQQEIYLYTEQPAKKYNLTKPNYNNDSTKNDDEDEDINLPINLMPTPLRLLQQYQQDKL